MGVLVTLFLALFPGEPFDFEFGDGNREQLKKYKEDVAAAKAKGLPPPEKPTRESDKDAEKRARKAEAKANPLVINQARLDEKAKQAEKLFGIKADQYKDAVEQATAEANEGGGGDLDAAENVGNSTFLTLAPFVVLAAIALNYATADAEAPPRTLPAFVQLLARTFPREARVFGIAAAHK